MGWLLRTRYQRPDACRQANRFIGRNHLGQPHPFEWGAADGKGISECGQLGPRRLRGIRAAGESLTTSNPWLDLLGLINGFQVTQAIHVASTLGIADHLNEPPAVSGGIGAPDANPCRYALSTASPYRCFSLGGLRSKYPTLYSNTNNYAEFKPASFRSKPRENGLGYE